MAIVMGLDQHRAQITAEWIDTDTGELGRARISPAVRGDVRRFLRRFAGQRPDWKKAYVKLREGEKIPEFLEGA